MLILVKLGGSLITDKQKPKAFRSNIMTRISSEIKQAKDQSPHMQLIIGHGSGSFGHMEAKKYNTKQGVTNADEWLGFSRVGLAASELNQRVRQNLIEQDIPIFNAPPSALAQCEAGHITQFHIAPIQYALNNGLTPLVYGDVAFDTQQGGTIISTETVFDQLVAHLPVDYIFLMGEVDGVYDTEKQVIPSITPANINDFVSAIGGSRGTDVTGGMQSKVESMLNLVQANPNLKIRIMNGLTENTLFEALCNPEAPSGTVIQSA